MGILFLLVILIIPYMWGCLVTGATKNKDADHLSVYVQGILSLFLVFLGIILVGLKTDMTFSLFTIASSIVLFAVAVLGLPFLLTRIKDGTFKKPCFDKSILPFVIAATALGLFSILFTHQSYVNDATIETVKTTLETGKIYVYSSLEGKVMLEGLPIYNKLFVIPLLYAVLSKITFTDITIITGLIVPVITYVLNILIMWRISGYTVSSEHRNLFMYSHLVLLIGGTFIPGIAIPASVGFPLLRQGYTGYAWAYAVLAPFVVLMLLEKRYLRAGLLFLPIFGLLKLDSIYFAFKDFSNSYYNMGASGKLWIMYLCAIFYWIYVLVTEKKKFPWQLILSGCAMISFAICDLYKTFEAKESKQVRYSFLGWMVLASIACVSFVPFKGVKFGMSLNGNNKSMREVISVLENWDESDPYEEDGKLVVCGTREVMNALRISTTKVLPAYGRDLIEPLLTGYNYEYPESGQEYVLVAMDGLESDYKEYTEEDILEALIENWQFEHTDIIVLKSETVLTEKIWNKFESYGFDRSRVKIKGDYQYIHR